MSELPTSRESLNLLGSLGRLSRDRPVFHSEADFQHALAWQIHLDHPEARIRLETRPIKERSIFLDLFVLLNGKRIALELKFLTKPLIAVVHEESFELRSHSANDQRRYDFIKDIARLEQVISVGGADRGAAIVITNDPLYWKPGRVGSIDEAFHLMEGRLLSGSHSWAETAGVGTMAGGREQPLSLSGEYALNWSIYSDVGQPFGQFRMLIVEVTDSSEG